MKIDITSLCFGFKIKKDNDSGTAAWATSIGQAPKDICYIDTNRDGLDEIVYGMMYKSHSDFNNLKVRDVVGLDKKEEPRSDRERMMFSVFEDVYVNNKKVNGIYTLTYEREDSQSHKNRLHICYAKYLTYNGHSNKETLIEMAKVLGCNTDACWFVSALSIKNQKELHFTAIVVNPKGSMTYDDSKSRKKEWEALIPEELDLPQEKENHQQIFYGAPGTGKSHSIKDDAAVKEAEKKNLVFRTTFHPDSDYSTFVGTYKPTMKSSERVYTPEELTIKLKEIKTTGTTYPCHKFAAKYWESIKDLSPDSIKQILNACGFTDNYSVEVGKGIAIGQEYLNKPEDGRIIYTFCPQAFTNAYVKAWNADEDVYLIIEEINRGNCAQIFGDLFQLLDRKNGVSEYPVEADTDLQNYLQKVLADTTRTDIPDEVKSGKKLMLPSNLYIWATMNTSDQSLFPIDSAFKRRWEWKYIKIKEGRDENGNKFDWKVDVKMNESGTLLPWWDFIKKINEIIASMTSSADKQLGYFFCCAKDGVIDEETFVSKVIFYLWNDVFKDYGFEDASLFRYTAKDEEGKEMEKDLTFPDFYDEEGEKVNTERLTDFVKKVMSWKKTNAEQN